MSATEEVNGLSLLVRRDEKGPYLIGGKCTSCQALFFPKQSICPRCTGKRIEETPLSRKGKLYTYTEVYQKPPDYGGPIPYFIGRVLLPEGVFVLTQLKAKKEDLKINTGMKLVVEPIYCDQSGTEMIGYAFVPA